MQGSDTLLLALTTNTAAKVIGITGPPGAGKSTLVNSLLRYWTSQGKKVAVLAVDPSSPFNYGALLGDRIRMSEFYTNPDVFIRSLATRGALGGLNARMIEITDVVKEAGFDHIIVETVGVGQSEVEIAGLADCTIVALVPEAGDEVQTLKAGLMEIADIFVVNKADRDASEALYRNLRILAHEKATDTHETAVVKTVATEDNGVKELADTITSFLETQTHLPAKRVHLFAEKARQLIQAHRMKDVSMKELEELLTVAMQNPAFNLYAFASKVLRGKEERTAK